MAYNTGNPSGSSDPRDLSDSSADIDTWATSTTANTHPDRLGTVRKTWRGMENEFNADQVARASEFEADQDSREAQFVQLMISGGYTGTGASGAIEEYASGIAVSAYKEIIRENGEFWRAAADTTLPYTTTGAGMPEGGAFVNVGDGVLRQDLADGTAMVSSSTGAQPIAGALDSRYSGRQFRIAVIGDSITQSSFARLNSWPGILNHVLQDANINVDIKNFAVGGATLSSALNDNERGSISQAEATVSFNPDVVMIALGYNDIFTSSGTLQEASDDFDALVSYLLANTSAEIEFIKQRTWDHDAITPDTSLTDAKNRNVIPQLHTNLAGTGQGIVSNSNEYLDNSVISNRVEKLKTAYSFYEHVDSEATAEARLHANTYFDLYRTHRLGWHTDGLHPAYGAHLYYAGQVLNTIMDTLRYPVARENVNNSKMLSDLFNPDEYWSSTVRPVSNGLSREYVLRGASENQISVYNNFETQKLFYNWVFRPHREFWWSMQRTALTPASPVTFSLYGIPADTNVISIYNGNSDTWLNNLIDYDNRDTAANGAMDAGGALNFTFLLSDLLSGSPPASGDTVDVGIRVQNNNMPSATFYDIMGTVRVI